SEINVVDQWGGTPLDDAIRCGFKPVCEFLVSKGGIIGKTAFAADDAGILCEAGAKGNLNCLRGLARRKVDMNLADYDKRTAIHLASSEGKLKAVKCLIEELKADPNVYDRFGGTPLDDAQRHGHKETVAYLKSQGAVSGKGGTVSTQDAADLCDAASSGDLDKLRAIVKKGIDANSGDYDLRTAIHLAAAEGLVQVLKCLFDELEGNPNVVDRWGGTPLDDAKRAGKKEVIEYLESKGAVPGKFTMFSDNALITTNAAGKNDLATLRGITTNESGLGPSGAPGPIMVDVNEVNIDKRTALHVASAEGILATVECLVEELHASFDLRDRWGRTALDDAAFGFHEEVVAFLKSKGARTGKAALKLLETVGDDDSQHSTTASFKLEEDLHPKVQAKPGGGAWCGIWCRPDQSLVRESRGTKLVAVDDDAEEED
ncbi:unnamed protein product, partial [Polarella glacialis]